MTLRRVEEVDFVRYFQAKLKCFKVTKLHRCSDCMLWTHPSSVVQDEGVGPAVVRRVGVGVVSEPGQHGGDDGHVPQHILGDFTHPLGQSLHVDWLDHLVCGPLNPAEQQQKNVKMT